MPAVLQADRDQALAFRLNSHHLARRLPSGALLEAAAACGIQNTPPGSAALALNARIGDLTPAEVDRALEVDKTLLQLWSLRGSPYVVPTIDAGVFTLGPLPDDEESFRVPLLTFARDLDRIGMSATEAFERVAVAVYDLLDGPVLTKPELSGALGKRLPESLLRWCEACKSNHVSESLLRLVGLRGELCFAPRKGNAAAFVRTDRWLGAPPPRGDPEAARAELVRRYLRCYGPSTSGHLASWAGIAPAQARRLWTLVEPELAEVDVEGKKAWLHERDVAAFASPPAPSGVRLLPPSDSYLLQRDRETLLPDKALHRRVWRAIGSPGVALLDGRIVATWRQQKKGKRLLVTVERLGPIASEARTEIEAEAELVARHRGCSAAEVSFAEPGALTTR